MTEKKIKKMSAGVVVTARELETLKLAQQGKTNEEIAKSIGRTKWTVKFHLKNVMKKLSSKTRTQAVSRAVTLGLLSPIEVDDGLDPIKPLKVGIVGCGRGGHAIIDLFKDNPLVEIIWVADKDPSAIAIPIVDRLGIEFSADYKKFIDNPIDVVINLTGSSKVAEQLRTEVSTEVEIMGGVSARIMWQLFEERRKRVEEKDRILREHETLYHLGLVVESIDSQKDVALAIIDYAMKLTGTPAGSIAIFNEEKERMELIAAKGFSQSFSATASWGIRKDGLTGRILAQDGPLLIPDIREDIESNELLVREGVRSILASPLTVEGRIIGILYVNDFKRRGFRAEDVSLFSLLTIYAGLTLERVKSLEETKVLSITDGLTGLYNQRYLMEQVQSEIKRGSRHSHTVSILMIDIDRFKNYNDTYGHLEGNKVLKAIGEILDKNSRANDTVSRFGGEEFCIIMPQVDKKGATAYANRLKEEVASYAMPNRKVTISGGVASFPEDAKTHLTLLKSADKLLYKAKKEGRNKICV
ncbi:MAG: diguanylate cyclase [Deltaproteobacteria bacterium]|nr:diguanylate cyclase [Deltaproteobacteria bacterium]